MWLCADNCTPLVVEADEAAKNMRTLLGRTTLWLPHGSEATHLENGARLVADPALREAEAQNFLPFRPSHLFLSLRVSIGDAE